MIITNFRGIYKKRRNTMDKEKKMKQLLQHLKEVAEINSNGDWGCTVHQAEWRYIKDSIAKILEEE